LNALKPYRIKQLRIAILGTRGIPNQYGGFEQVACYLGKGLVEKGHEVTVYSTHTHTYQQKEWNGIRLAHCYDPGYLGSVGQFVYDLNCILDARKKRYDVWLMLGYTSSSVWSRLYPSSIPIVTNMDGLEWKRSKYSAPAKRFLRFAEKLAVQHSRFLVADSRAIQSYLGERYHVASTYISYGAEIPAAVNERWLDDFGVETGNYFLVLARMEPENNIEMILNGFSQVQTGKKMLVIGNIQTRFGQYLQKKFQQFPNILFHKAIYEKDKLDALRAFCYLYFHGHSCGGTNPSLLEAMAAKALIAAHDNPFNRAVLDLDGFYFSSADDVAGLIQESINTEHVVVIKENNILKIQTQYNWSRIIDDYERLLLDGYHAMHP
jgi:glycosyltransferase involved in cell wall biosynthesis